MEMKLDILQNTAWHCHAFIEGETLSVNHMSDKNASAIGKLTAQIRIALQVCE